MIPLEEAQEYVLASCSLGAPVETSTSNALGCVLASDVVASESVPSFDNTAMDGYAIRAGDATTPGTRLVVVGELRAGMASERSVGAGEAIQIMTGAPIPPGADAVINVEATVRDGEEVTINSAVERGLFIRAAGSDVMAGETVLTAGTALRAAHLGVLASIGKRRVACYPRLRVGVLSTGDELVAEDRELRPGEIRESNKDMLVALVAQANATPVDLGVAVDDETVLAATIEKAIGQCDALITSGGVSMGEYDFVKVVLEKLGEMRWMQIAIQPAKPFAFGRIGARERTIPVFGLPGNPVSSFVSFELLTRPALRKMMGHGEPNRPFVLAICDEGLPRRPGDGKTQWQRVHGRFGTDGRLHVTRTGEQGSHQLANSAAANGLARVPDGPGVAPGGDVEVLYLD